MALVKICGLTNPEDLESAMAAGADFVGLNGEPSSPRYLEPDAMRSLAALATVPTVAVYGPLPSVWPDFVSLVQGIEREATAIPPGFRWFRVYRLRPDGPDPEPGPEQMLVLDAYHPQAYGGTGQTVDWQRAARIVKTYPRPVMLAGGLTPENVAEAVQIVQPYAVDVSSGVELSPGKKDVAKLREFIRQAKKMRER